MIITDNFKTNTGLTIKKEVACLGQPLKFE